MCLLIFQFGGSDQPFLLCSNRDETFQRKTLSGKYYEEKEAYYPIDELAGGTWIAISGKENGRFAVILNFHVHRYDLLYDWVEPSSPKSRGLIPQLFLESESNITPREFGSTLLDQNEYQGYNLIIGDRNSCCYISNADRTILQLQPNILYGVTNGRITDEWPKVTIAKQRIQDLLHGCTLSSVEEGRALVDRLVEVMKDSTPLPDATYQTLVPEFMKLSAICVSPLEWNQHPYGTRTITIALVFPPPSSSSSSSMSPSNEAKNLLVVEFNRSNPELPLEWERNECLMTFTPFSS